MSAPPTSLPAEIAELMWISTTVGYQQALSGDGFGQQVYADSVALTCWVEPHSYTGVESERPTLGRTTIGDDKEASYDLYFDGDLAVAQGFGMDDMFTITTPGGPVSQKPRDIGTYFGPPFDNTNAWLIVVRT